MTVAGHVRVSQPFSSALHPADTKRQSGAQQQLEDGEGRGWEGMSIGACVYVCALWGMDREKGSLLPRPRLKEILASAR